MPLDQPSTTWFSKSKIQLNTQWDFGLNIQK